MDNVLLSLPASDGNQDFLNITPIFKANILKSLFIFPSTFPMCMDSPGSLTAFLHLVLSAPFNPELAVFLLITFSETLWGLVHLQLLQHNTTDWVNYKEMEFISRSSRGQGVQNPACDIEGLLAASLTQ